MTAPAYVHTVEKPANAPAVLGKQEQQADKQNLEEINYDV
jgi:hypothetical protein